LTTAKVPVEPAASVTAARGTPIEEIAVSRIQRENSGASAAPATEWRTTEQPDCWAEMQSVNAGQGHAAWASLASQRPAVEDRLSRLVHTIERDIIPRLVRAHAQAPAPSADANLPTRAEVEAFTAQVMDHDDNAIHAHLAALRARSQCGGAVRRPAGARRTASGRIVGR